MKDDLRFITENANEHSSMPYTLLLTSVCSSVQLFSARKYLPPEASGPHVALLADRLSVTGNVLRQRRHTWDKARTPTASGSCLPFSFGQSAPRSRAILFRSEHST